MQARWLLPLLLIAALPAAAQDKPPTKPALPPTGTVLLAALPDRADLVIHTGSLPALLKSAERAGFGAAPAWRKALREQLLAWGHTSSDPEVLASAGAALLDLADGEVLLASIPLPAVADSPRATLFALRSSADKDTLGEAVFGVVEHGLRQAYPGEVRRESVLGRDLIVLDGARDRLFVRVQNGLLVASDNSLALGLFFRRLAKSVTAQNARPVKLRLLEVRHGPPQSRWTGWMAGDAETVSWKTSEAPGTPPRSLGRIRSVWMGLAMRTPADAPVFPVPVADWVATVAASLRKHLGDAGDSFGVGLGVTGKVVLTGLLPDSAATAVEALKRVAEDDDLVLDLDETFRIWALTDRKGPVESARSHGKWNVPSAGGALPLVWPALLRDRVLPMPVPAVDPTFLKDPVKTDLAALTKGEGFAGIIPWKAAPDVAGEIRGRAWTGPVTCLALRTLRHVALRIAPGRTAPETAPDDSRGRGSGAPLPPPR